MPGAFGTTSGGQRGPNTSSGYKPDPTFQRAPGMPPGDPYFWSAADLRKWFPYGYSGGNAKPGGTTNLPVAPGPGNAPVPGNRSRGGGDGGAAAAAAKAAADAAAAKAAAGQSFLDRAKGLDAQIKALQYALSDEGFKKNLDQNLTDILQAHNAGVELLKTTHAERGKTFLETGEDTEKAAAQQAGSTFENLVRERQDTMSNLLLQGAGETDSLRAMVMAARNFRDNQSEGNRAYFDTMRSVKSGLTDLNIDTKTALQNSYVSLEAERDRLWQDFYNRQSDTYTQLGNLYGQKGDYYAQAKEMGKPASDADSVAKSAEEAYMNAAKTVGKSYVQQGVPQWLQDWKGIEAPVARQANTDLAAAQTFEPLGKAEGANLRTW